MTIEINGMAHAILTVSRFEVLFAPDWAALNAGPLPHRDGRSFLSSTGEAARAGSPAKVFNRPGGRILQPTAINILCPSAANKKTGGKEVSSAGRAA
jgi:hypothetical protein